MGRNDLSRTTSSEKSNGVKRFDTDIMHQLHPTLEYYKNIVQLLFCYTKIKRLVALTAGAFWRENFHFFPHTYINNHINEKYN